MIGLIELLRKSWFGPLLIGVLLIVLVVPTPPNEVSAQGDDDDDGLSGGALAVLLLAVGGAVAGVLYAANHGSGPQVVLDQLEAAVQGALDAKQAGNRRVEFSRLAKAIGAAESLMRMTSSCDTRCDDLRSDLQTLIGMLAHAKSFLLAVATCNPNGVIQGNEQCDPLAVPTGCPIATTVTFCNEECRCQAVSVP